MEKMVVAYVCDSNYIQYLKISMDSIRRYNKNVEFAILSTEQFNIEGAKVFTFKPDTTKFNFTQKDRMGAGVYYKFWLPELPYDKILYIDCDVICQRPLNSLWNEQCDFICATESHKFGQTQAKELGLKKYALSGMMLMNLNVLREANFTEKCLEKLNHTDPKFHDETIINQLFSEKIKFVDVKYNYCRSRAYINPIAESDAYLLHYVGEKQKEDMLKLDNFHGLEKLRALLKGKSVAVVGNSTSILKSEQATEIDKHDIVIRFNKGFPSDLVGHKTDIVFFACTLTESDLSKYGKVYRVKRSLLCKHRCDFTISEKDKKQLDQRVTRDVLHSSRFSKSSQASTGFICINFVLSCSCTNIDLYGFDFFQNPTYYNPKWYKTLHNGADEGEKVREYESCGLLKIN